jgi:prolyl-tRNA synthetase
MIVPIAMHKEGVLEKAEELKNKLGELYSVQLDASDKSPGWKFSEQEIKGIPTRIEMGPKDIENNQCIVVRRDTREKIVVSLDDIETKLGEILEQMQADMFERALAHREEHTYDAVSFEEFCKTADEKPGFIRAMWCGDQACEDKIKEEAGCTSRCMPFEQKELSDKCICCGRPAKKMVYWGKAY